MPEKLIYRPTFETTMRDRVYSKSERERLIKYLLRERKENERPKDFLARRRTGLVLYFALLTSLRHGEISAIKKVDFDREAKRLKVERFKTKKKGVSMTIFEPLTNTHLWVLTEAAELYPEGGYFFSAKGKNHNRIYDTLRSACAHLGIPYGSGVDGGIVLHDARHTFVTEHDHAGTDRQTTRSFSGHSADSMAGRYSHATFDSRTRAIHYTEKQFAVGGLGAPVADGKLKGIYEAVRSGKMSYGKFKKTLEDSFTVFLH